MVQAVIHSVVIFFGAYLLLGHETIWSSDNGRTMCFLGFGQYIYTYVLITVCFKVKQVIKHIFKRCCSL